MDNSTFEVRLSNWKSIIEESEHRPQNVTKKQWLQDHHIPEKQYYYWLRKIRQAAYQEMNAALPAVPNNPDQMPVAFAEFSGRDVFETKPGAAVIIKTSKSTIEISSDVSERLMVKLVKAVAHAL